MKEEIQFQLSAITKVLLQFEPYNLKGSNCNAKTIHCSSDCTKEFSSSVNQHFNFYHFYHFSKILVNF